jgi:hypothetical protein
MSFVVSWTVSEPNMPAATHSAPNCRWGFISGARHGRRGGRSLVWICEYPYRTIRGGPADDCEGCRRASALGRGAAPHLDADVRELERMMQLVSP